MFSKSTSQNLTAGKKNPTGFGKGRLLQAAGEERLLQVAELSSVNSGVLSLDFVSEIIKLWFMIQDLCDLQWRSKSIQWTCDALPHQSSVFMTLLGPWSPSLKAVSATGTFWISSFSLPCLRQLLCQVLTMTLEKFTRNRWQGTHTHRQTYIGLVYLKTFENKKVIIIIINKYL